MTTTPDGMWVFGLHVSGGLSCWKADAMSTGTKHEPIFSPASEQLQPPCGLAVQLGPPTQLTWLGGKAASLSGKCKASPGGQIAVFFFAKLAMSRCAKHTVLSMPACVICSILLLI